MQFRFDAWPRRIGHTEDEFVEELYQEEDAVHQGAIEKWVELRAKFSGDQGTAGRRNLATKTGGISLKFPPQPSGLF